MWRLTANSMAGGLTCVLMNIEMEPMPVCCPPAHPALDAPTGNVLFTAGPIIAK